MKNILFSLLMTVFVAITFEANAEDLFYIPNYVNKNDRELIKKARDKIMRENPKCVSVSYGSTVSERGKNGNIIQKKGQYFITCDQVKEGEIPPIDKQSFNVFFKKEEIIGKKSNKIFEAISENKSKAICKKAIVKSQKKLSVKEKSNFDEFFLNIQTEKQNCTAENYYQLQSGYCSRIISGNNKRILVQIFNYGLSKYRAECHISPNGKLDSIDIVELEI
jgi:hypothetical protein